MPPHLTLALLWTCVMTAAVATAWQGGVGIFDACTSQWQASTRGIDLGAQYGGFLSQCQSTLGYGDHAALKTCVRTKCEQVFLNQPGLESMLAGCRWFVDWFELADNPRVWYVPVDCPPYFAGRAGPRFSRPVRCARFGVTRARPSQPTAATSRVLSPRV